MNQIWIVVVAAVAVVTLAVPLGAIVLVSIASRREEAAHSLSRGAPGSAAHAARRLLGFRTEQMTKVPDRAASYTANDAPQDRDRSAARGRRSARSGSDPLALVPVPRAEAFAPSQAALASREVRFGHARRPGSDARQFPASRQPQPGPVRADQRQGAGV
jgi:hypothetical protein